MDFPEFGISIKADPFLSKDEESQYKDLLDNFISDPYLNNTFKGKLVGEFMDYLLDTADKCGPWTTHYGCIGGEFIMFYAMVFNTAANSWHVVILDVGEVLGVNDFGLIEAKQAVIECICSLPLDKINDRGEDLLNLFKHFEHDAE
tara:strand:+ start:1597 stop:2034 length:438 start_codon:yes stop_codon:yes gene_type:complete